MTAAELKRLCLAQTEAEETFPFGPETSVFKVAGKMFALSRLSADPLTVSVKCEPQLAEQLRAAHSCITAGYHLNKRHWNTVLLDGTLPEQMVCDLIEDSYDLVVSHLSQARQRALGWSAARCPKLRSSTCAKNSRTPAMSRSSPANWRRRSKSASTARSRSWSCSTGAAIPL